MNEIGGFGCRREERCFDVVDDERRGKKGICRDFYILIPGFNDHDIKEWSFPAILRTSRHSPALDVLFGK